MGTPGAAVISAFSVHLYLLTTSGASPSCIFVLVRYQAEGVESQRKRVKRKCLDVPRIQCKRGKVQGKGLHVSHSSIKYSLWLVGRWIWRGCIVLSHPVFPLFPLRLSGKCCFVHGLLLGYGTGFGERRGPGGVVCRDWGGGGKCGEGE